MLAIAFRSLVAFALLFAAALIGRSILRRMPNGPAKRFLGQSWPVVPRTLAERKNWWPVFWIWLFVGILFIAIWRSDPLHH